MRNFIAFPTFLVVTLAHGPASSTEAVPQTRCHGRLGREFTSKVVQGVPLLAGISTGMKRDQVKRIAPRLSLYESRQHLELFPGMSFRATALFRNFFGGIEWIRLFGPSRTTPVEALTAHYGKPIQLNSANSGFYRVRVLKWCDGLRILILTETPDEFSLLITSEQPRR